MQEKLNSSHWGGLCEKCDHKSCCNDYVTPFVTTAEYDQLSKLGHTDFADSVLINGINGYALKKKKNSEECIFWDKKSGCTVYEKRPFDCKVFPFDIYKIDGKYTWVVYSCNSTSDWSWSEGLLRVLERDTITMDLLKHIDAFSDLGRLESSDKSYDFITLREVILPKEHT